MYRNVFRRQANGLETSKKCCILEKKAANKAAKGVDMRSSEESAANSTLENSKKIRGASQSTTIVS